MLLECGMGGCAGMGCHASIALLLIALGIGAIVKYKAVKATSCQMLGKIVGYFIMIVAAVGLICTATCAYKSRSCHKDGRNMGMGKATEGMQLPTGHPDISKMKMPSQAEPTEQ